MNKSIRKMENNLLTHTKHETTHFDVLSIKRQTVKVSFLPFAGKINVKLNLSINTALQMTDENDSYAPYIGININVNILYPILVMRDSRSSSWFSSSKSKLRPILA